MFHTLINVILPVFIVIGAGYGAIWTRYFSGDLADTLMRFTQNFAIPCLLFRAISSIDLSVGFDLRLLASFYAGATLCFAAGLFGARLIFGRPWEDSVVIGFCCLFSNGVLLGLPITERAYGPDNLIGNFAIIAFHSPFCYTLGITVMEFFRNRGATGRTFARAVTNAVFRNPLIVAILLGFVVNISGLVVPEVVDDALAMIARAAIPCALFALGGVLVQYRPEGDARVIAWICTLSLLVHPALVWSIGTTLDVPTDLFRSGVLMASMAPGVNGYVFANMYGRAKRVAASSLLIATAVSVLTVWFWLGVLG